MGEAESNSQVLYVGQPYTAPKDVSMRSVDALMGISPATTSGPWKCSSGWM